MVEFRKKVWSQIVKFRRFNHLGSCRKCLLIVGFRWEADSAFLKGKTGVGVKGGHDKWLPRRPVILFPDRAYLRQEFPWKQCKNFPPNPKSIVSPQLNVMISARNACFLSDLIDQKSFQNNSWASQETHRPC